MSGDVQLLPEFSITNYDQNRKMHYKNSAENQPFATIGLLDNQINWGFGYMNKKIDFIMLNISRGKGLRDFYKSDKI